MGNIIERARDLRRVAAVTAGGALLLPALAATPPGQTARPAERDVAYVQDGTADQRLDLYLPDGNRFPTVVFVHGGSLQESGERRTSNVYASICEPFVAEGIGCATVDYRLAPTHRWPAMPDDVAAAFGWVRAAIGERGGDPSRVFLFGHSSGCHLAAAVGTNPRYLAGVGLDPSAVAGVIAMGCTLTPLDGILRMAAERDLSADELTALWAERSGELDTYGTFEARLDSDPSRHVGAHVPPTLVVVAERERFHPPILEQGARFVGLLYEHERPADLVLVPGTHMSSIAAIGEPGDPAFAAIRAFIADPLAAGAGSR